MAYNYHRKPRARKRHIPWYYSKVFIIFLIIIFIFLAKGTIGIYRKSAQSKELRTIAEAEYALLENKKQQLEKRLDRLDTETGQEALIREKYNVSKFGEKLVIIVDRDEEATTTAEAPKGFFDTLIFWK